jgi:hypothetical protein
MEIHFEDLMTHPHETLAGIGRFIEHELDYEKIRKVGMGSVGSPNTSFRGEVAGWQFSPIGRWKQGFSPQQLEMFEGLVGPFLKELGYSPATSSSASRSIGLIARRELYQSDFSLKLALKSKTPLGRILMRTPPEMGPK